MEKQEGQPAETEKLPQNTSEQTPDSQEGTVVYHKADTQLCKLMLLEKKERSHPLATIFQNIEFQSMGNDLQEYSYAIFEKPDTDNITNDGLIAPNSQVKGEIYSREEGGILLFDQNIQQGQARKWKLLSPPGKNPYFLKPLVTKMTLGHIGVVKRTFTGDSPELFIKDENGEIKPISKNVIYYFVYVNEEIKIKSKNGPSANTQNQNVQVTNFDKYEDLKNKAAAHWKAEEFQQAADLWFKTYKQIKSSVSKKVRQSLNPEVKAQFDNVRSGCIKNTLRAMWKLKKFKEGLDIFLKFLVENEKDCKFLSLGFEFMLEFSQFKEFNSEISRIKTKYSGRDFTPKNKWDKQVEADSEFLEKIEKIEAEFLKKFRAKQKKDDDEMRANFQKSMWSQKANANYEKEQMIRKRMMEN